jgi:hypothetical protein
MYPSDRALKLLRTVGAAVTVLLAGACLSSPTEPNETAWEAELVPVPAHTLLSGSAGAVSDRQRRRTEAGISIQGAFPSSDLPWRVRAGSCGGTRGPVLGSPAAYPDLRTGELGSAEATVRLTQAMSIASEYMVEVWQDTAGEVVIACGVLRLR